MNLHCHAQVYVQSINDIINMFVVVPEERNSLNRDLA